jgi:ATP-binding cassette, subfamily C, bacterial LapB
MLMEHDSLLQSLSLYTKLYHTPFSIEALITGLPIEPGEKSPQSFSLNSSKSIFSRAADNAGLITKLIKKELLDIPTLTLPVILILENNQSCILDKLDFENKKALILDPHMPTGEKWIEIDKLQEMYLGYAFYLTKKHGVNFKQKEVLKSKTKHWFWDVIGLSRGIYMDVIRASFAINIFVLASPLFTMNVYDRVVPNNAVETLWVLALGVSVIYMFDAILKFLRTYFLEVAAKKSDVILSSKIFEHVMDFKMHQAPRSVGSFASNVKDFDSVRSFLTSTTIALVIDLPFVIIFLLVIGYIGGSIVYIPILFMSLILLYTLSIRKRLQRSVEETYEASAYKNSILIESLGALETLKMLGSTGYAQWKWEEATANISAKSLQTKILSSSIITITSLFMQLSVVFVVVYGAYLIAELELTMGGLIAIVILSSRTLSPIGQVASLIANYAQTRTAYEGLDEIMHKEIERPKGKQFIDREELQGEIEFRNVKFTYPDSDRPAIDDVSFTIRAGEKVAILGKNGSGKTTVGKMVMNFYDPDEGSILIDGIDIKQLDPSALRQKISYVPQNIVLFSGTLKENIVYKAPYVDDETIIRASNLSGLASYVHREPKGYDVYVGERGDTLSGGQKQALGITRAFLLDLPLVILDEPTNSMDFTTEIRVKDNLEEAIKQKTVLLTTHKNVLLDLVERVIIFDNGKIVYDGPKEKMYKGNASV